MRHDPAMGDQPAGQPGALSLALAEPIRHVRRGWIAGLTLASLVSGYITVAVLMVVRGPRPVRAPECSPRGRPSTDPFRGCSLRR
jgi:hypothetical protein